MSADDIPMSCPITASLGVLGRKWAFMVLRDAAMMGKTRFSEYLEANPGLSGRVLSMRLGELVDAGLLSKRETPTGPRYAPTAMGMDTMPILMELLRFGAKHHARDVFCDGRPRTLEQVLAATA
ncbi:MAG: winged helix-turn-helix transcriptional regulator [Thermoplasmatota archaeon]